MQPPQRSPFKGGAGQGVIVSQIGWDPVDASAVLTLMPAGHAAGMYEVSLVIITRTAPASNAGSATLTWSSPIFGAESEQMLNTVNFSANTGTSFSTVATTTAPHRSVPIMSDGTAAITLQMADLNQAGVVDVYASARLVAA